MIRNAPLLLLVLLSTSCRQEVFVTTTIDQTPAASTVEEAVAELDLALDALFEMSDNRRAQDLVESVAHAARGRVLLEKVLGNDVDNYDMGIAMSDSMKYHLILVASQANKFTSRMAADLWLHDLSTPHYSDATGELAVLDVLVQGFKRTYLSEASGPMGAPSREFGR